MHGNNGISAGHLLSGTTGQIAAGGNSTVTNALLSGCLQNIQQQGIMMEEITRINHVGLRVRDMEVSREFYGKLGFAFLAGPIGPEPVAIVEHPSGININLILNVSDDAPRKNVLMEGDMKYPGYTHIALEITDYNSAKSNIENLGFPITGEVEYNGAKFFFIRDPDGNVIEFHQPASS